MDAFQREAYYKGLIPILRLAQDCGVSVPGAALSQQMFTTLPDPP
jgi:hypothetical protein